MKVHAIAAGILCSAACFAIYRIFPPYIACFSFVLLPVLALLAANTPTQSFLAAFKIARPKKGSAIMAALLWAGTFGLAAAASSLFPAGQQELALPMILTLLFAPVLEELFFRGFLLTCLDELPKIAAISLSTFFFACFHSFPGGFVTMLMFGAAVSIASWVSGSVITPIAMHLAQNAAALALASFPHRETPPYLPIIAAVAGAACVSAGLWRARNLYLTTVTRKPRAAKGMVTNMKVYPMKMKPVYKEAPWGGEALKTLFSKDVASSNTGESWELSAHPNGQSCPMDGDYAGIPLSVLTTRYAQDITGTAASEGFPLLFKLIDARKNLSVQVHPNDALAALSGSRGKTEMWIILHAEAGAGVYAGFKSPIAKSDFRELITSGKLESSLNFIRVSAGDAIFIPAGLVHAIGAGLVVAEIQQSSDITYRVYDYNRLGLDGKPRQLHIDKGVEAADTSLKGVKSCGVGEVSENGRRVLLTSCKYFSAAQADISGRFDETCDGSFNILFFADGAGTVTAGGLERAWEKGDTFLIPAAAKQYAVSGAGRYYIFSGAAAL